MFWDVSDASWKESELKKNNCDIYKFDCICLINCGNCNILKLNYYKNWCIEINCIYVIEMWRWFNENCKKLW